MHLKSAGLAGQAARDSNPTAAHSDPLARNLQSGSIPNMKSRRLALAPLENHPISADAKRTVSTTFWVKDPSKRKRPLLLNQDQGLLNLGSSLAQDCKISGHGRVVW